MRAACRHSRKSEHRHCGPPEQQVVEGALTRLQYQRGACLNSILCLARSESDVAASSSARWVHRRGSRRPLRPAMGAPLGRARLAGAPNRPVGFNVTRPGTMASQVFRTRRGALCAPASIGVAPTRIHHFVCRPLWPTSTIGAGQTVWVLANRPPGESPADLADSLALACCHRDTGRRAFGRVKAADNSGNRLSGCRICQAASDSHPAE